jgi:lantibiotic modifying enzyme
MNFQNSCNIIRKVRIHQQSLKLIDNLVATNLTYRVDRTNGLIGQYFIFLSIYHDSDYKSNKNLNLYISLRAVKS